MNNCNSLMLTTLTKEAHKAHLLAVPKKKLIKGILDWGDADQDGKIGLSEAIGALQVTTGSIKQ